MDARHRKDILPPNLPPRGLNRLEVARYSGFSPSFLDKLVDDGRMPRPAKIGRCCLWDRKRVDLALDAIFNVRDQGSRDIGVAPEFVL